MDCGIILRAKENTAMKKRLFALFVSMILVPSAVLADSVYVDSVAELTNAVANATDGTTIVLEKSGSPYTFTDEWMDSSSSVKNLLVVSASNVTIEGADSSSRNTWTTGSEPVIIDGNSLGRIVQVTSKKTGVTFKNITFTGGYASGGYGGGMNGSDDKTLPVCTNCVFRGNTATKQGSAAFYCTLQDCLVADSASHVALYAGSAYGCDMTGNAKGVAQVTSLYDCGISNNVVPANGDNLLLGGSSATYSNCVVRQNSANRNIVNAAKLMMDCTFEANTNTWTGSSIMFSGTAATNCVFRQNRGGSATSRLTDGFTSLSGCRFEENYTGIGGVTLNADGIDAVVEGCTFVSNTAYWYGASAPSYGAAIRIIRGSSALCTMTVTNCTFVGNNAYFWGGAIYASNSVPGEAAWTACTVVDSAFTSNTASYAAGVYGVRAIGCTFDGNIKSGGGTSSRSGNAAVNSVLQACDFNDAELTGCIVDRCRIHQVTNAVCIFAGQSYVTNTLVEYCAPDSVYASLVCPDEAVFGSEFVNCTFVTNRFYTYLITAASYTTTQGISFVNCLFNGTEQGQGYGFTDIDARPTDSSFPLMFEHVSFANTYYGAFTSSRLSAEEFASKTNTASALMLCENPRFVGMDADLHSRCPDEPYWALSYRSPLRGKGQKYDPEGVDRLTERVVLMVEAGQL